MTKIREATSPARIVCNESPNHSPSKMCNPQKRQ